MSDFDEEAERERLREKYERDEERRKETQQMSELLLKGATMTNRHCNDCGSPIFRYNGQEFCPSCQRVTSEGDAGGQTATDGQAAASEQSVSGRQTSANGQSTPAEQPTSGERPAPGEQPVPAEQPTPDGRDGASERTVTGGGVKDDVSTEPSTVSPAASSRSASADDRGAREALLRALTRHARLAEETDDPRRAKDHLSAAREAAAALDELD